MSYWFRKWLSSSWTIN